jgi:hypothetical protein
LPHGGGIKIKAVAAQHNFDISGFEIVDALHSEAGLYLARQDKARGARTFVPTQLSATDGSMIAGADNPITFGENLSVRPADDPNKRLSRRDRY